MKPERWTPRVTVAAIVERDGRFLVIEEHTSDGLKINQPAGHLEAGETLVDAVKRETLEDDQYDTYGPWMDQAAYQARKWPDQQIAPLLADGNTSTYGACFDGAAESFPSGINTPSSRIAAKAQSLAMSRKAARSSSVLASSAQRRHS